MIKRSNDTDILIGARIRQRRLSAGLSMQQVADMVGITYQQINKYETGINRVSAGRLFDLSQALGFDVGDLRLAEKCFLGHGQPLISVVWPEAC